MVPPDNSVLISIFDKSDGPLDAYHPDWKEVLKLRFHDTDGQLMGLEVFSPAQAQEVYELLARHPNCEEVVVHCAAGQSRSAAIAMYLGEAFGIPSFKEAAPFPRGYGFHNRKVYRIMCDMDPQHQ